MRFGKNVQTRAFGHRGCHAYDAAVMIGKLNHRFAKNRLIFGQRGFGRWRAD